MDAGVQFEEGFRPAGAVRIPIELLVSFFGCDDVAVSIFETISLDAGDGAVRIANAQFKVVVVGNDSSNIFGLAVASGGDSESFLIGQIFFTGEWKNTGDAVFFAIGRKDGGNFFDDAQDGLSFIVFFKIIVSVEAAEVGAGVNCGCAGGRDGSDKW